MIDHFIVASVEPNMLQLIKLIVLKCFTQQFHKSSKVLQQLPSMSSCVCHVLPQDNIGKITKETDVYAKVIKVKVKVWVLVIVLLTRLEQQQFTISEVTADWHELMIPWHIMRPSIAHDGEQLDPRCSTQTYHRPNQRTRPSPHSP